MLFVSVILDFPHYKTIPILGFGAYIFLRTTKVSFTGVIICVIQTAINGSNYLRPGEAELLDEEGVNKAIWGSKMTFALEHFTLTSVWSSKACILILYGRLT